MNAQKRILLKLTGEILIDTPEQKLGSRTITRVIDQIDALRSTHTFGIVVGGGNFFRGAQHGVQLGIQPSVAHQVGMLATLMNGLIITDLLEKRGIQATLLTALADSHIGILASHQNIEDAIEKNTVLVFAGGTGNPFFTTDTNAVLRGLQMDAEEIWKATSVDGVYDADPHTNPNAQRLQTVSYDAALHKKLGIMDATAFALAQKHGQRIRVFNIFKEKALIHTAQNQAFGSVIQ